jgi:transcriptional regulator with XRE-family HTH domain
MRKKERLKLINNRIKDYLEVREMSQQELADRVGTNRAHICKIVNGKSPSLSLAMAIKIAKELDVSIEVLFYE